MTIEEQRDLGELLSVQKAVMLAALNLMKDMNEVMPPERATSEMLDQTEVIHKGTEVYNKLLERFIKKHI